MFNPKFIPINFSSIVKQATFAYVNHTGICSWYKPVLSNEGSFFLREATRFFDWARTHDSLIASQLYQYYHVASIQPYEEIQKRSEDT